MADEATSMAAPGIRGGPGSEERLPTRPPLADSVRTSAERWWRLTNETEEQLDTRLQVIADNHALFPFDRRRKDRNQQSPEPGLRTKKDARIVQNPHCFRASQRSVAMLVPDDTAYIWRPRKRLATPSRQAPVSDHDQLESQFAATVTAVANHHFEECNLQGVIEEWCLLACQYRGAVLKLWYQEEWEKSPWNTARLPDDEEKEARAQSLWQSYQNGDFQDDDPRFTEMMDILTALAESGPVQIWAGLVAEVVPIERIRVDGHIRSINQIYKAEWIAELMVMSGREILDLAPFQLDPEDPKGFTGVHPDDLSGGGSMSGGAAGSGVGSAANDDLVDMERQRRQYHERGTPTAATSDSSTGREYEEQLYEVRQVYDRLADRVFIMVAGVDYIVDEWRPNYRTKTWYPFFFLGMNPQYGTWYNRSDTELASDAQARVNQRDTDDEKLREYAKPRIIYNKMAVDDEDWTNLAEIPAGGSRGVRFPEGSLRENMMDLAIQYDPRLGDSFSAQRDFDKMVGFSEQLMGGVGQAKFATEVEVAQAGTNLMATQRQKYVRRSLRFVCESAAELLVQALNENQVKLIAGQEAYWPPIYGQEQVEQMRRSMMVAATQIVQVRMQEVASAPVPAAAAMQYPGIENPAIYAQQVYEELAVQSWGGLEPPSREQLLRRCKLDVRVSLNADMERLSRYRMLIDLAANLGAMGVRLQPQAASRILGDLLDLGDEVDDLVMVDPAAAVQSLLQAAQEGRLMGMPPEAMQMLAALGALAQQATMQNAMEAGAEDAAAAAGEAGATAPADDGDATAAGEQARRPARRPAEGPESGTAGAEQAATPTEGPLST